MVNIPVGGQTPFSHIITYSTIQATQELSDGKYLHVSIITDRQQVIVSTNNIKAFPVNCTRYELVVIRITAGLDIGTDADNFEF